LINSDNLVYLVGSFIG